MKNKTDKRLEAAEILLSEMVFPPERDMPKELLVAYRAWQRLKL